LTDNLLDQTNPFAIITAAHLKTKDNPQERYTWKWTITRALYEKGFSTKDIEEFRQSMKDLASETESAE
jgi:SOS response regulatory protein OraA/RecX